jgi:ketosteroid isomerase-like protein
MSTMLERIREAQNAHDAESMAALFADNYASSQPLHGGRAFVGRAQVQQNWTAVFEGVPNFVSELVAYGIDGDTEWGEWYWHGQHADGSSFAMRGVTIFLIRDGLIAEGRLYMEPVDTANEDIDAAVQELYKPPAAETA